MAPRARKVSEQFLPIGQTIYHNQVDGKDVKFHLPFGMIVSGPSSSGKSTFILRLLDNYVKMIEPTPSSILYAYGEYSETVRECTERGIRTLAGLPSEEDLSQCARPLLLILDDLMLAANERYLSDMFTKKSHHQHIGVVFLTQNLFERPLKVARNNSQYIVLMRAPNAALSIRNIGSQLFPRRLDYFLDAYEQATEKQYGYLLLDLHAGSNPKLRLRTKLFPDEHAEVFLPK